MRIWYDMISCVHYNIIRYHFGIKSQKEMKWNSLMFLPVYVNVFYKCKYCNNRNVDWVIIFISTPSPKLKTSLKSVTYTNTPFQEKPFSFSWKWFILIIFLEHFSTQPFYNQTPHTYQKLLFNPFSIHSCHSTQYNDCATSITW